MNDLDNPSSKPNHSEQSYSMDWANFKNHIEQLAHDKGYLIRSLGQVGNFPVLLLTPMLLNRGPNILAAAGFHGDEPAGWLGVIRFLENVPQDILKQVNLSFIPLLNVTGSLSNNRKNKWGEDPNRWFCHTPSGRPEPSQEGLILLQNLPLLKSLACDGYLSLHEDVEMKEFYVYTFENGISPGLFSEALRFAGNMFFDPCPDGIIEGANVSNGVVFCYCDGSFEDCLFHEGIPRTACTETPGLLDLNKRVEANMYILTAFVNYSLHINI